MERYMKLSVFGASRNYKQGLGWMLFCQRVNTLMRPSVYPDSPGRGVMLTVGSRPGAKLQRQHGTTDITVRRANERSWREDTLVRSQRGALSHGA